MEKLDTFVLTPPSGAQAPRRPTYDTRKPQPRETPTGTSAALLLALHEQHLKFGRITDANRTEAVAWVKQRHYELLNGWPPMDPISKKTPKQLIADYDKGR